MRYKAVVVFDFDDDAIPGMQVMTDRELASAIRLVLFGTVENEFQDIGVEVFRL